MIKLFENSMVYVLSRTGRMGKGLLVCAMVAVPLALCSLLVVAPLRAKLVSLSIERRDAESQLRNTMLILKSSESVKGERQRYAKYDLAVLPDSNPALDMQEQIADMATATGVSVLDMRPQTHERIDYFEEHRVRVQVEGRMDDLMAFFHRLEASPQLIRVSRLDLTRSTKKGLETYRKADLLVTRVVYREGAERI